MHIVYAIPIFVKTNIGNNLRKKEASIITSWIIITSSVRVVPWTTEYSQPWLNCPSAARSTMPTDPGEVGKTFVRFRFSLSITTEVRVGEQRTFAWSLFDIR